MSEQETTLRLPPVYVHKAMMNFPDGRRFVVCFIPMGKAASLEMKSARYFPGIESDAVRAEISDRLREKCLRKMGSPLADFVGRLVKIRITDYLSAQQWVYANAGAMLSLQDSVEWGPVGKMFNEKVMPGRAAGSQKSTVAIVLFPEHY
jgi:hypothetical protein